MFNQWFEKKSPFNAGTITPPLSVEIYFITTQGVSSANYKWADASMFIKIDVNNVISIPNVDAPYEKYVFYILGLIPVAVPL